MPAQIRGLKLITSVATGSALLISATLHAATCFVSSAALAFGQYDGLAPAAKEALGVVRVSCTKDSTLLAETVNLTLQLSPSPPGAAGSHRLNAGGSTLSFDLFTDLLHTRLWGDGSQGTFTIGGLVALTAANPTAIVEFPIYGRIPPRLPSPAGPYSGLFTVVLNF